MLASGRACELRQGLLLKKSSVVMYSPRRCQDRIEEAPMIQLPPARQRILPALAPE
jgi:hypothetical protein